MSLAFSPSLRIDGLLPNSIIVSSNHVYFYIHRHRILDVSSNAFFGHFAYEDLFPTPSLPTVHLPEDGDVINVLLHTIYGFPCTHFHPSLETVEQSLTALIKYGVLIEAHTTPHQPLYQLILSHAPHHPIDTYALAAHHDLEDLAVAASGHLLSYDTSRLTDALASRIGPVYLKRLFLLHHSRLAALRNIVLQPPATHPATPGCADGEQGDLVRAWALAAARLVWDATPSKPSPRSSSWFFFWRLKRLAYSNVVRRRHLGRRAARAARAHRRGDRVRVVPAHAAAAHTGCGYLVVVGQGTPPPPSHPACPAYPLSPSVC